MRRSSLTDTYIKSFFEKRGYLVRTISDKRKSYVTYRVMYGLPRAVHSMEFYPGCTTIYHYPYRKRYSTAVMDIGSCSVKFICREVLKHIHDWESRYNEDDDV